MRARSPLGVSVALPACRRGQRWAGTGPPRLLPTCMHPSSVDPTCTSCTHAPLACIPMHLTRVMHPAWADVPLSQVERQVSLRVHACHVRAPTVGSFTLSLGGMQAAIPSPLVAQQTWWGLSGPCPPYPAASGERGTTCGTHAHHLWQQHAAASTQVADGGQGPASPAATSGGRTYMPQAAHPAMQPAGRGPTWAEDGQGRGEGGGWTQVYPRGSTQV